jgi:hypothetical protein
MKPRQVILLIELKTNEKISELKDAITDALNYEAGDRITMVVQMQTNVVQRKKKIVKK